MVTEPPPTAKKTPVRREFHGDLIIDEFGWMDGADDPDTMAYADAENAYAQWPKARSTSRWVLWISARTARGSPIRWIRWATKDSLSG